MLYAIGIPVVCLVVVAALSDMKRRKTQKEDLTSAKELGEIQFYKDINNNRNG